MIDDIDRIMYVMSAAFEPRWGEAWNRRQVTDSLALPNTHCIILDAGGDTPDGTSSAAGFLLSRHAPGEDEMLLVAVLPEYRGRGIGSKLISTFKADAKIRGSDRVFLEMRSNNPAEKIYRKNGFTPIGRRRNYYLLSDGSRMDAITFACKL